jgi:hypothetical protein
MATEGTKFQINYKLNDGTLINLYAATVQELETGLTDLSMVSTLEGQAPTCSHGNMTYRTGTSARGPWRAWMCSAPKGAADKCDPIFLR